MNILRVMTFNLRFVNEFDGENSWANRCELLVRTIAKYRPHVLGTQEGKPSQLFYLREQLEGYRMAAQWRHWDDECQYPTLYFLQDRLELVEGGEFWLSESPEVHLSKSWGSAFPRMISYARLKERQTLRRMWYLVTHLDHISETARRESAKMIRGWTATLEHPAVLLGDFNDSPGSEVHRILTLPQGPFKDSWELRGGPEDERAYTHHKFTGIPANGRIDWILVTPEFRVLDAAILRDHQEGRYPSDHFPYMARLELEGGP